MTAPTPTGVDNELALRHVPEVEPRMDDVAGPVGRRGDQVGRPIALRGVLDPNRVFNAWLRWWCVTPVVGLLLPPAPLPQVGGFTLMQAGDMRRVAPWWIKYSEDVRADPLVRTGPPAGRTPPAFLLSLLLPLLPPLLPQLVLPPQQRRCCCRHSNAAPHRGICRPGT